MQKNIFFYILCTFIFSANNNFIFHEGQLIESNTIIIKFSNTYAPLLGKEEPLNIEYIQPFQTINNKNFKSLIPLFSHIKDFKNLHYEHELHKYYKLILHNHDETFTQIISDLNNLDIIENVEFNGVAEASLVPNDELYPNQWDHDNQRQAIQYGTGDLIGTLDCDLDTDMAWDITIGNSDVIIAIVDTGVDLDHPDLIDNIVPGYNFINEDLPPDDVYDHGTACAGIAAATINNDIGIAGVCPNCSIMSVKVLDDNGFGDWAVIADGVVWASDNEADVINLSLGGGSSQEYFENAINYVVANGTVAIAASGNINTQMDFWPASYEQCIAVGAMSPCCERKNGINSCDAEPGWGSTYGDQVDVVAPGVRIFTTGKRAGYWTEFNGTSSACPHVAGIAGLMLSHNSNLSPETIREFLRQGADDIADEGYDIETGYGKVNAYNTLMLVPLLATGDLNLDGEINISDILILLDYILIGDYNMSGDMNSDGINNINDIMLLIQIILD
jgi:thermitase